jgi:hypothetical protein
MQLGDWTRLSGLVHLTLRGGRESHHGMLAATLPRLTALRSLVLAEGILSWKRGLPDAGGHAHSG